MSREVPTVNVVLDPGAKMPTRAHEADAGYDLFAMHDEIIMPYELCVFDTGVHIEIPKGYVGMIKSKSGLYIKHELTTTGVIDSSYTGSIRVGLKNNSNEKYYVWAGEKIGQLVLQPIITPELVLVDKLAETDRGDGGFGSTGR